MSNLAWYSLGGIGGIGIIIMFVTIGKIEITPFQTFSAIFIVLGIGFVAVLYSFFKGRHIWGGQVITDTARISEKAKEWALKNHDIHLERTKDSKIFQGAFKGDPETFIGMILFKTRTSREDAGQPVSMVFGTSPFRNVQFNDSPSIWDHLDPFHDISNKITRIPTPKTDPQQDPAYLNRQFDYHRRGGTSVVVNPTRDSFLDNEKQE